MTAGHYHCSANPVGRGKGASVMHKAAYRAGEQLYDERGGQWTADYGRRARSVIEKFILTPANAPAWSRDRQRLWNAAETAEARSNGRIATELELGLPHQLDPARRRRLLVDFLAPIIARYGVAADIAIHTAHDRRNIHAHILLTHRQLAYASPARPGRFWQYRQSPDDHEKDQGREKQIGIAGVAATPADIEAIRKSWADAVNRAYAEAGLGIRVDHRSHERRGIEDVPQIHLGPAAAGMERRHPGSSERGEANRAIAEHNERRRKLRQLRAEARRLTQRQVKSDNASRDFSSAAKTAQKAVQRQKHDGAANVPRQSSTPFSGPVRGPWRRFEGMAPGSRAPPV
ncbi:MAG: MobA/MobL family protein [Alphaproteobacteria bacterium]|nr:MobA/MobL family protein [Alphaproteobacteria bacterium]